MGNKEYRETLIAFLDKWIEDTNKAVADLDLLGSELIRADLNGMLKGYQNMRHFIKLNQ